MYNFFLSISFKKLDYNVLKNLERRKKEKIRVQVREENWPCSPLFKAEFSSWQWDVDLLSCWRSVHLIMNGIGEGSLLWWRVKTSMDKEVKNQESTVAQKIAKRSPLSSLGAIYRSEAYALA